MLLARKLKDSIYVGIQLLLFVWYLLIPSLITMDTKQTSRRVGLVLSVVGLIIFIAGFFQLRKNLTPFPSVLPDRHLVTKGIYHFIRHPLYTGIMGVLFGYAWYAAHGGKLVIAMLITVLFYFKSVYEEQMLLRAYPGYEQYRRQAGRFLPRLKNIFKVF